MNGIRTIYSNIAVNALLSLRADIENGNQEQGCGSTIGLRFSIVTGITGATADQTGATIYTGRYSDAANDLAITVGSQTVTGCIWKLDGSVANAPTFTRRTYAQFVSDGGSVTASTINGASLPNSQIFVPRGYVVISDAGPNIAAMTPYYARIEDDTPVVTLTSIDGTVANVITCLTADTSRVRAGDVGTVASATGNTSVNGTWQVASVVAGVSITLTSPTSTAGAVTGTPTLRFTKPTGVINANVVFNPLGDYNRGSVTQRDVMGSNGSNWLTGVGAQTITTDGTLMTGFAAIIGTDPAGGECIYLDGDSQIAEVRDGTFNGPTAPFAGDSVGNLGWANRAMYANGLPAIRTAVPGMRAGNSFTKNDDKFRLWLAQFCDRSLSEMGRNDATVGSPYATFTGYITTRWTRIRTALRGKKIVVGATLSPLTAEVSADHWKTGRSSTYQSQAASGTLQYPGGYIYAQYHPSFRNGTFITGAAGGLDGFIDQSYYASNLDGSGLAEDGAFAVDGTTDYRFCGDGTHFTRDGHAGIAAQLTTAVLRTAKLIP